MKKPYEILILGVVIALLAPLLAGQNGTDCVSETWPGCLDPGFNDGAWVVSNKETGHAGWLVGAAFQDQKIVAGGTVYSRWTLARYDPNGVTPDQMLDRSFGTNGYAQLPTKRSVAGEGLSGIAIQRVNGNDYIVAAGTSAFTGFSWGIARFTPDGVLDKSFGASKYNSQVLPFGTSSIHYSLGGGIAVQSDGKIVSVGQYSDQRKNTTQLAVVRLNPNGSLDTTFGTGGKFLSTNLSISASALAFQTIGGQQLILVAGYLVDQSDPQKRRLPSLMRLKANGELDLSFGIDGIASLTTNVQERDNQFQSVAVVDAPLDEDRKIIAVGSAQVGSYYKLVIARFMSDGKPDPTALNDFVPNCADSNGYGAIVQPDYKVIVVGACDYSLAPSSAAIWRFDSSGVPDTGFGPNGDGFVKSKLNGNGGDARAIIQSGGKFVVVGQAGVRDPGLTNWLPKFAVARYIE